MRRYRCEKTDAETTTWLRNREAELLDALSELRAELRDREAEVARLSRQLTDSVRSRR